ncbi:hypothetical protein ScPMuIL_014669 [Solemya velum]
MNNDAAQEACRELGLELAILPTSASHCQAWEYSKSHGECWSYWIGLYYQYGNLTWIDGSTDNWWEPGEVTGKDGKPCYVINGYETIASNYRCSDDRHCVLCGKDGEVKVMKNLPNSVSILRSSLQSYIYHIQAEDPYALNGYMTTTISSANNPFRIDKDWIFMPNNTELSHLTYTLEITTVYSCGGEETSSLCVSVYDHAIDKTSPLDPVCQTDQTTKEPLHFLFSVSTRDMMCTAIPMLNISEPEEIMVNIMHLQFINDENLFPYVFNILTYDKIEVVTFLYKYCDFNYTLQTTPPLSTTEMVHRTTDEPDQICVKVENDTVVFPTTANFRNETLQFSSIGSLDKVCNIRHSPVQNEMSIFPEEGLASVGLLSSHEPNDSFTPPGFATVCVSWVATDVTVGVAGYSGREKGGGVPSASTQKGDAMQTTANEECGVLSCWNENTQIGVIVAVSACVVVVAAVSLVIYKKVGKNGVYPYV